MLTQSCVVLVLDILIAFPLALSSLLDDCLRLLPFINILHRASRTKWIKTRFNKFLSLYPYIDSCVEQLFLMGLLLDKMFNALLFILNPKLVQPFFFSIVVRILQLGFRFSSLPYLVSDLRSLLSHLNLFHQLLLINLQLSNAVCDQLLLHLFLFFEKLKLKFAWWF
jgi:hypothetical protein